MQDDFDSLTPGRDFSRRGFVRAAVGSGFAAAVLRVMAQAEVLTDSGGLLVGELSIPVSGFKLPAYRAALLGKAQAPAPVGLLISEILECTTWAAAAGRVSDRSLGRPVRVSLSRPR